MKVGTLFVRRLKTNNPHHQVSVGVVPKWSNGNTQETIAVFEVGDAVVEHINRERKFTMDEIEDIQEARSLAHQLSKASVFEWED